MSDRSEPSAYEAWYHTPRGAWIGDTEFDLLHAHLRPAPGASVLDVGCGTGWFTRRLARAGLRVTGVDADAAAIRYAQSRAVAGERYLVGDARALPFPARHFDFGVAITSFCFIADPVCALTELARVTRRRVALGLLNRHSLLYRRKGRHGGQGAYRGAHWHTPQEVRHLFEQCGMPRVTIRTAIFLSDGGGIAKRIEAITPARVPLGGFLLAVREPG
jgi:SAM-dependent methyltransferase